tara:strand:+ start:796 stop:1044 length:249 start_codon:yes stop_codon:yes gene_type:complete
MPEITNDLMDMIIADESPSSVSDKIKDILFAKSAEKVDAAKPEVAGKAFGQTDSETEVQDAVADNAAHISGEVAAEIASADQ